jgi:ubiquinone/menaquinone biosynthesis C-methylase UbiE
LERQQAVEFEAFERAAWERKANLYQASWGSVTAQAAPALLEAARHSPDAALQGLRLLDCGCGSGQLCELAQQKGAWVHGCDYSGAMLRVANAQHPTLSLSQQNALSLAFASSVFDVVTLNYLLLHVPDQEAVLLEARRVLAIGGRLIFALWCSPSESAGLSIIFSAFKAFADMQVIPPGPDIFLFANESHVRTFLTTQGFEDIRCERIETEWRVSSAQEFIQAVQAGTRMGGLLELQKPAVKQQLAGAITERLQQYRSGPGFRVPTPTFLVSARRGG